MAEILTLEDFEAVKNFSTSVGETLWTDLYMYGGGEACVNVTCSEQPLSWRSSGMDFVFHSWMTGGVIYENAQRQCASFENGKENAQKNSV